MNHIKQNSRSCSRTMIILFTAVLMVMSSGAALAGTPGEAKGSVGKNFGKNWETAKAYTLEVAELMPEEHYTFKPVQEIDSFAGHLVHIVSTMYFFGSKVKGVKPPAERPKAEGKSKAEVIAMLKKAFAYATEAINGLTDEEAHKKVHLFGDVHLLKANVIRLMNNHMTHHRGGLVIYLRLKGKKPPQFRGF